MVFRRLFGGQRRQQIPEPPPPSAGLPLFPQRPGHAEAKQPDKSLDPSETLRWREPASEPPVAMTEPAVEAVQPRAEMTEQVAEIANMTTGAAAPVQRIEPRLVEPAQSSRGQPNPEAAATEPGKPDGGSAVPEPTILCVIDGPNRFAVAGSRQHVYGWATGSEPIVSVAIFFDDVRVGAAQYGMDRPDVAASHPGFLDAGKSGFRCGPIPFPQSYGEKLTITVAVTGASGHVHRVTRSLSVVADIAGIVRACREAENIPPATLTEAAQSLSDSGHFEEAECLLAVATLRFPDHLFVWNAYAEIETRAAALGRGRADEGQRRWQLAQQRFPDRHEPWIGEARALIALGRGEAADGLLTRILQRWPDLVEADELRADLPVRWAEQVPPQLRPPLYAEARLRCTALRQKYPANPAGYVTGAYAHMMASELTAAETLLVEAMNRFPDRSEPMARYAMIATMRGDWPEAERRWQAARERFPHVAHIAEREKQARNELRIEQGSAANHGATAPREGDVAATRAEAAELTDRDLMMAFEGIGNNCDFGSFQRHFSAEPLGLLRFASVPIDRLLQALESRFAGVGDPENTIFELRQDPQPEYWLGDKRFNFSMHTFIYPEAVQTEEKKQEIFRRNCRRLAYLAQRLISDLEDAEKIFVYQRFHAVEPGEADALLGALRQYGPNTLLCVGPADAAHGPGTVEIVKPGLMRGYLRTFTANGPGQQLDIENWQKVCRQAYALHPAAMRDLELKEAG